MTKPEYIAAATLMTAMTALGALPARGADFFDTSHPASLLDLGVRLGVNTSTRNLNNDVFNVWNNNAWGTGVDVGVVADINFRDFFSVQPGIFFESRSGKYSYVNVDGYDDEGAPELMMQFGHSRSYNFTIPVMASFHFNVTDGLRWTVDAGPYLQFGLKNTIDGECYYPVYMNPQGTPVGYEAVKARKSDFGMRFGTALEVLGHYTVGVHYNAGWLHPWSEKSLGGRNKTWVFSIGYNL